MIICKNCGAQLKNEQKFCNKCGAPVLQAETPVNHMESAAQIDNADLCGKCGARLREGARFCVACGTGRVKKILDAPKSTATF